jgi:hypothetical protein
MTESGDVDESTGAEHASTMALLFLVRDEPKVVVCWIAAVSWEGEERALLATLLASLLSSTLLACGSSAVHATKVSQAAWARSMKAITCSATSHADSRPPADDADASGFRAEAPERT